MVRLKEIAAVAGVSVMTVSKALRDQSDIAVGTRERIRLLAQQMGYVPDAAARGMRSRKTMLLGLVIPATTDPVFARMMLAIEERAHELGYDLLLGHSLGAVAREEAAIRRLLARKVDGLFISPVYRMDPASAVYEEIQRRKLPAVILGHRGSFCREFVSVETDDMAASAAITRYLVSLGHKRIAFFTGPPAAPWAQERYEGYRRALREADLPVEDSLIYRAGSTIEEGVSATLKFLQESSQATAIQAANDLIAVGVGDTLLNQGLRLPGNISVTGFGNLLVAEYFRVPLTTVRQPKLRLGIAAMESMLKLLRGELAVSRRLPAEIIVRSSTGTPPKTVT
ncbi:MAG: LacI family transcriptional regulator [Pedosphaera sp.]|nr:LacI family transcriptional regulator [Pedosphaera sp.]